MSSRIETSFGDAMCFWWCFRGRGVMVEVGNAIVEVLGYRAWTTLLGGKGKGKGSSKPFNLGPLV